MERFKAYKLTETADKKIRAEFVDMTLDDLDPGDVVVRVAYSDVNYKDALAATGKGKILRRQSVRRRHRLLRHGGQLDRARASRRATRCSASASTWASRTTAATRSTRACRATGSMKLPKGMSLWEAMAFGTAGYTAGIAIVRMEHEGLKPANGPVIVNGATGGVGSIALAALARLGYHVVALTGKESEADWLKKLGAKEILLRQSLNLEKIKPLDKSTWAGAVDNLGGEVLAWICEHHEGQRRDRLGRPRGERQPQHHGDALHPARRAAARHQLGRKLERRARDGLAPPRHRPEAAAAEGNGAHRAVQPSCPRCSTTSSTPR